MRGSERAPKERVDLDIRINEKKSVASQKKKITFSWLRKVINKFIGLLNDVRVTDECL